MTVVDPYLVATLQVQKYLQEKIAGRRKIAAIYCDQSPPHPMWIQARGHIILLTEIHRHVEELEEQRRDATA